MPRNSYSKEVTRQLQAAELVITSARKLAEPIAAAIDGKIGHHTQPGETPIDWRHLQVVCGRVLLESANRLRQVDEAHTDAEVAGRVLRSRRDAAVAQLRGELRRVRFYLDETLSKQDAKELFPQRRFITTIDPANLARLGKHLGALLRGNVGGVPVASVSNLPSADALAESVETATRAVEEALEALAPELRRRSFAFDNKEKERKEALETWRRTRDLLTGVYRLAGFDYLADQLRERRRKKAAEEGEGELPQLSEAGPAAAAAVTMA